MNTAPIKNTARVVAQRRSNHTKTDAIYAGIAAGLAALNRIHNEPTLCLDTLNSLGLTLDDFVDAGVEDYDLAEIHTIYAAGPSAG